ncbi:hypothetical protein B0J14DRAFT_696242 [Halenospora varia]|nr:hypothetical protein B0J14DRAFT_696242 [Halenospora varia]
MGEPTPTTTSTTQNPFIFPSGDVSIKVTYLNAPIIGLVSSSALKLASPVWAKFLFPPWTPQSSSPKPVEMIDCLEDDGMALFVLLNIAHLRFRMVPERLGYRELLGVAILCDQYDCAELVRPWLGTWMCLEESQCLEVGQEQWLFIAWVFGREDTFSRLSFALVRSLQVDSAGKAVNRSDQKMANPMPLRIIENILAVRRSTITSLLQVPYDCLTQFEAARNSTICNVSYQEDTIDEHDPRKECDAITYGSLTLGLARLGLFPRKDADEISISISELASSIQALVIMRLPLFNRYGYRELIHENCGFPDLTNKIETTLANIPSPVLESHTAHMRAANSGK